MRFVTIFEHGELLLVSAAIVGAAMAELVGPNRKKTELRVILAICGAILILTTSAWFADVAAVRRDGSNFDAGAVAWGSLVVFGFALVVGIACIIAAELSQKNP